MFRNYLTYQFAEGFDRDCASIEGLEHTLKSDLLRCSHALVVHFGRALRANKPAERGKGLFTAMAYLQDCREILERGKVSDETVLGRFKVLEGRLEQLFSESAESEGGQLRMLG